MAEIGDVARRVAWHVDYLEFEAQRRQARAIAAREPADLDGHLLPGRAEDHGTGCRHEFRNAADMVRMMVSHQDCVQPQPIGPECPQHRSRITGVHNGHGQTLGEPVEQPDVIVLKCRYRPDVQRAQFLPVAVAVAMTAGIRSPSRDNFHSFAFWPPTRPSGYALDMNAPDPDLRAWLAGPLGGSLLEQERAIVATSLECAFGLHCVQVGSWGEPDRFLGLARTQRAALVASSGIAGAALVSEPAALALQSDSVDVMLLPHTLEFEAEPHEVLREAGRVLTGEGQLLVLGFEPLGSWSLRNAFTRGGFPPGLKRMISERRLADWLKLLGFEIAPAERFFYAPPMRSLRAGRARDWLEWIGRAAWPRLSGAYLLHARKRVFSMTPVRMRSRLRTAVIGGLVEPAARRAS